MKVLVTGAGGFLGRHVVARLAARGHPVRAMIRPASAVPAWTPAVETVRADLRGTEALVAALEGVDLVLHLAVGAPGDDEALLADTLRGTERLLEAMARSPVKRLVLASSFVVYDWGRARGRLDEDTPLADDIYRRGGYDIAKLWQERLVSAMAQRQGWALTILRPGFIWGAGRAAIAGMGRKFGSCYLLIGPWTRLPLTHVENCADCFVTAIEQAAATGGIFNVVDGDGVRVWRYAREYARGTGRPGLPLPIPYLVGLALAHLASATSRLLYGKRGRLPSLLTPSRYQAQFKPLRFSNRRLEETLRWRPPLDFDGCLARTYGLRRRAGEGAAGEPAPFLRD